MSDFPLNGLPPWKLALVLSCISDGLQKHPAPICSPQYSTKGPSSSTLVFLKAIALLICFGYNTELLRVPAITISRTLITRETEVSAEAASNTMEEDDHIRGAPAASSRATGSTSTGTLAGQKKTLRDFMTTNHTVVPSGLDPPTGNVIVIARNASISDSAKTTSRRTGVEWNVKELEAISDGRNELIERLKQNPNHCRAPNFEIYAKTLFGLLELTDETVPRGIRSDRAGMHTNESMEEPDLDCVLEFALRNCLGKLDQRLESCNRPFKDGKSLGEVLRDWSLMVHEYDAAATASNTEVVRPVRLTDSLYRMVRWLRLGHGPLEDKRIDWNGLIARAPGTKIETTAVFGPANAHIWAALLSYLLVTISTNVRLMKAHDRSSNIADRMSNEAFAKTSRTLSAFLEALAGFFHRREREDGWMSPSDVLGKLLGDVKVGLIGFLESKAFPGFRGDGPRTAEESSTVEDTAALEEEQGLFTDADVEDENIGTLGTMVATTLNNVCGFVFAARDVKGFYGTRGSTNGVKPLYFLISGENTPRLVLTKGEVKKVKRWVKKQLSIPDQQFSTFQRLHLFFGDAPDGVTCTYHCESILMAAIRHEDLRCVLYKKVKAKSTLWKALSSGPTIAVCTKKACCHCMFTAVHADPHVFNTDGTHGLGFKTRFFGLTDDAMRQFSDLLLETIKRQDTGSQTQQSSPNRSLHGGGTPPKASMNAKRVFEVDEDSEEEEV
ncbi:hypothetical protein CALCODRAFT_509466 [Calocera cornea HHB12733]|uniref:Uncharacterized protein n=1 Tax=Calocera cornea HHB12733 TaxID=1353952 RepID=A0A165F8L2_9BASI|nr:hypothetical protein CALCODRAFT_509466 [Calocera cornea HHB12733]